MTVDTATMAAVATSGELLIRAAAALGTLTPEQQAALGSESELATHLHAALQTAASLSEDVRRSLKRHPPRNFVTRARGG